MKKKIMALLVICCILVTMAVSANAEDADFYYWNYEETLDDVGGRLALTGKDPSGELDAVYNDGVISNTFCVDMTSSRFAETELDRAVDSFSFASWFYLPSEYANRFAYTTLFSIGAFDVPESFVHSFFETRAEGDYNFCIWLGATGAAVAPVATDGWHHVGWTYDAQTQTSKVYFDGALVYDQVMASAFSGIPAGTSFYIGHQPVQWLFTDTRVDETVFAPSVWSEEQIKALYNDPANAAKTLSSAFAPETTPETTPETPPETTPETTPATTFETTPETTQEQLPQTGDNASEIIVLMAAVLVVGSAIMIQLKKRLSN